MNAYNYGVQWNRTPWTKIDYDRIPKSDLTNMGEYNRVSPKYLPKATAGHQDARCSFHTDSEIISYTEHTT